ncbi:hypothetical protein SAMN04487967_0400 [Natronorubrum sediminis]|uniref:Domain of unknown function domain-containing protein n=1 Tax=Natronorubrum sediminis TaxID=640943 RepID=A0A1H6FNW1_9EURY|nr:hypothetical protein [Natronorubrum sediminis]SEH11543.1 hypothetical protein SAMN04487967_0400 [Natronorubrum sediminis]
MSENETRGILTPADKEWLRGETEYEHRQSEAKRRQEIRERVSAALEDFAMLVDHWSATERQKALKEINREKIATDTIEFLYLGLNGYASDAEEMTGENATDRALAFRRALSNGIRNGKEHFDNAPDHVLIDSNTELFEIPSVGDLQRAIDTGQWRDANDHVRGAFDEPDDAVIEKEQAAKQFHMDLHLAIERELYSRRQRARSEIKRHDTMVGSAGLLSDHKTEADK